MSMNIGNLKVKEQGTPVGRIVTPGFNAVVALREVNSTNEKAPAFDVMGLLADRRTWVKIGAVGVHRERDRRELLLRPPRRSDLGCAP